jgi:predicted amidohydrolase YtcJ
MQIKMFAPALLLASFFASAAYAGTADLILLHGQIKTGESGKTVQALAVLGGQVVAAGNDKEIEALGTAGTKVIDLQGRSVTPGLIENDAHLSPGLSPQEIEKAILANIDALHRKGVTSVRDVGIGQNQWDAYRALLAVRNLPERVCVTWSLGSTIDSAKIAMDGMGSAPKPPASFGDGRLMSCGADLVDNAADPATWHSMTKMIHAAGFSAQTVKVGTLRKGQPADLAVWDQGKCVLTLLDGEVVFKGF